LIENFRTHVLKEDINLVYYPVVPLSTDNQTQSGDLEFCSTCYVSDQVLGRDWFEKQGFSVSDQIWSQLGKIRK
jgi:hypothetical protein